MPKRSSKPTDINSLAKRLVDDATGQVPPPEVKKNPAAVALGRLGGIKGGKARAESLSVKRRAEIARDAALARWKRTKVKPRKAK